MPDASTIGRHLKRLRGERGLSQEALAERAGLSKDLVAKLEQGRRTSCRVTSLMRLAVALDVEVGDLTGKRERLGADRDGGSILALRDAILSPSLLPSMPGMPGLDPDDGGEPTPLADLESAITAANARYWEGDFGPLLTTTAGLIAEARLTRREVGPRAAGALAQVYQLGAALMLQLGKSDLAAIAAERGIAAAAEGDDVMQWAAVHATYAWVLLRQARLAESEALAVRVAEQIEPSWKAPAEHLVVWGNLLLNALAPRVVAGKDPAEYLGLVAGAAARLGQRVHAYQTSLGPTSVAMQTAYSYAVLRQPGKVMQAAGQVNPGDLPRISYGRHLLDVAQAHVDARQPRAAEARLDEARSLAPVWFRHQSLARSLVAEVREIQTRPSPVTRRLVEAVGLD
ncbi:MAG TPA: helix-turn-helix transcriptional regulator [Longimicrobiales bacterium]